MTVVCAVVVLLVSNAQAAPAVQVIFEVYDFHPVLAVVEQRVPLYDVAFTYPG